MPARFSCTSSAVERMRLITSIATGRRSIFKPIDCSSAAGRSISPAICALVGGSPATTVVSDCASAKINSPPMMSTGTAPSTQTSTTARRRDIPRRASASIGASASVASSQPATRALRRPPWALATAASCERPAPISRSAALARAPQAMSRAKGGQVFGSVGDGRFIS